MLRECKPVCNWAPAAICILHCIPCIIVSSKIKQLDTYVHTVLWATEVGWSTVQEGVRATYVLCSNHCSGNHNIQSVGSGFLTFHQEEGLLRGERGGGGILSSMNTRERRHSGIPSDHTSSFPSKFPWVTEKLTVYLISPPPIPTTNANLSTYKCKFIWRSQIFICTCVKPQQPTV